MKHPITRAALATAGLTLCLGTAFAQAQNTTDLGKREFDTNCASCHGVDGKGNGPIGELLRRSPPDLTQLAKKNGGVFPMTRLFDVIDGGNVPSHGTREMPVWGREFRIQDAEYYIEARGNYDSAALVRARVLTLLEYINRLQVR
jgi:mono/diheme cytochrome c family protein